MALKGLQRNCSSYLLLVNIPKIKGTKPQKKLRHLPSHRIKAKAAPRRAATKRRIDIEPADVRSGSE